MQIFFSIFFHKNLHISKICCIFALTFKKLSAYAWRILDFLKFFPKISA